MDGRAHPGEARPRRSVGAGGQLALCRGDGVPLRRQHVPAGGKIGARRLSSVPCRVKVQAVTLLDFLRQFQPQQIHVPTTARDVRVFVGQLAAGVLGIVESRLRQREGDINLAPALHSGFQVGDDLERVVAGGQALRQRQHGEVRDLLAGMPECRGQIAVARLQIPAGDLAAGDIQQPQREAPVARRAQRGPRHPSAQRGGIGLLSCDGVQGEVAVAQPGNNRRIWRKGRAASHPQRADVQCPHACALPRVGVDFSIAVVEPQFKQI